MVVKNDRILFLLIIVAVFGYLYIFGNIQKENFAVSQVYFPTQNLSVTVALARTLEERGRGLSGQEGLLEDSGMLFIFPTQDRHTFWMKDMRFPLDIIWINEEFKIVDIVIDASEKEPDKVYAPKENALFVLEVNAGFTKKFSIKIGDEVVFKQIVSTN